MKTNKNRRAGLGLTLMMILTVLILGACSANNTTTVTDTRTKVGIVLTEVGLGDRSFNDAAFDGLVQARNEKSIVFDYREPGDNAEAAFEEFAEAKFDLVIGLSDAVQADMQKLAAKYPDQQFLMIDSQSELPNIALHFIPGGRRKLSGRCYCRYGFNGRSCRLPWWNTDTSPS